MELGANKNKEIERRVGEKIYQRYAIRTHYITVGENYIDIIKNYVVPVYQEGDILSISEKIIALCQKRVLYKKDIKLSFIAKFLSKFVHVTPAGEAVGNPYKMQIAILLSGKLKVIYAAILAGIGKIFKKKGIFYDILGEEVKGIDGFCNDAYDDYLEMGILIPQNSTNVCDEIYEKLGIKAMIVDANDLEVDILGKAESITEDFATLSQIIKDNPAGQANQQTPLILIRPLEENQKKTA